MKKFIIMLFAIFSGVMLSQFPEYAQQYRQRVGGAVDELAKVVTRFETSARDSGLSREQALDTYTETGSEFLSKQGGNMRSTISRYEYLSGHLNRMIQAPSFVRLWVFAKERDMEIAKASLSAYEPAIPTTAEGATHAAAGFAGGWLLLSILLAPFGRKPRRYKAANMR